MASRASGRQDVVSDSSPATPAELQPAAIVSVLNRHEVRYVVIGAFAAIAQHAPIAPTRDIDFTPDDATENLQNLSSALKELDAHVRTDTEGADVPFDHDAASLSHPDTWNLVCAHGEFDIAFRPAGFPGGYRELATHAHLVTVDAVEVYVADLADVIRSKEAAGRPKDIQVLPALYRHQARTRDDTPPG
jgi:hypothetical protein